MQADSDQEGKGEGLILRDKLALDRTLLANERTLLAYVRTALALLVTGASTLHFLEGILVRIVGFTAAGIGVLMGTVGIYRFLVMRTRILRSSAMPWTNHPVE